MRTKAPLIVAAVLTVPRSSRARWIARERCTNRSRTYPPAVLGVKKDYLDAAFDEMQSKYGSIEQYFSEGLGIDAAEQESLRNLYLH